LERIIKKKILIHTIVFSPDGVSTAYLYNEIALGFKNAGYEVVVLTTTPHYNLKKGINNNQKLSKIYFGLLFKSNFNGISVYHIPLKKYKSTTIRLISFVYWHLSSLILGLTFKNIDFVLSPSPPLSIALVSILIAKKNNAKFIYNVQEIYPDLLISNGFLKSIYFINIFKYIEKYIYNSSSAVITIDQIFYNKLINRLSDKNKLHIISNFVDTEIYKPVEKTSNLHLPFNTVSTNIKLLYAGNIGFYQDWEPILYAAKKLKENKIEFWIIGEGVKKNELINNLKNQNITNVKIFPYQSQELMPSINSHIDIHFIAISKDMEQEGFPSKVYTIMASSKPMIIITGENTPLYNFCINLNCSIIITKNRNEEFLEAIKKLAYDETLRKKMGENGFYEIQKNYTKEIVIMKYLKLFNNLT
jgi:colanic acid biosynthesis glycosyl transferase WcaI